MKKLQDDSRNNIKKFKNHSNMDRYEIYLHNYIKIFLQYYKLLSYYDSTKNIVEDKSINELLNIFLNTVYSYCELLTNIMSKFEKKNFNYLNSTIIPYLIEKINKNIHFGMYKDKNITDYLEKLNKFRTFKLVSFISEQIKKPVFEGFLSEIKKLYRLNTKLDTYKSVSLKLCKLKNKINDSCGHGFVNEYISNIVNYLKYLKELIENKSLVWEMDKYFGEEVNRFKDQSNQYKAKLEESLSNLIDIFSDFADKISEYVHIGYLLDSNFNKLSKLMSLKKYLRLLYKDSKKLNPYDRLDKIELKRLLKSMNDLHPSEGSLIKHLNKIKNQCNECKKAHFKHAQIVDFKENIELVKKQYFDVK